MCSIYCYLETCYCFVWFDAWFQTLTTADNVKYVLWSCIYEEKAILELYGFKMRHLCLVKLFSFVCHWINPIILF